MARIRKSTYVPLIFLVYMTAMFAYFVPRNNELSTMEKALTVGAGYLIILVLWFFLRKKEKLSKEREDDIRPDKNN